MLSTECIVSKVYKHGENRIESVRSDLLIQVGSKDIYHMECQMKQGRGYSNQDAGIRYLNILLPFLPIRFKRKFEYILKTMDNPIQYEKAREKMEVLKKDLTKLVADCIIIINRKEENGALTNTTETDIVELMGKTCDYLFSKEPELLREVHKIMEPAIKSTY